MSKLSPSEVFIENSPCSHFVARTWYKKIVPAKCAWCGNLGVHRGKPLTLQMDHINGNTTDHRLDNLRWLCPNCHTQTTTYGRKKTANPNRVPRKLVGDPLWRKRPRLKIRKVPRPTKSELEKLMDTHTWKALGRKFGVSDNSIRKWARSYALL